MISRGSPFQNGTAHFKLGQPVLKPAMDFKLSYNIYKSLHFLQHTRANSILYLAARLSTDSLDMVCTAEC